MSSDRSAPRHFDLPDEAATEALGARLAPALRVRDVVALTGDLGAGKTTLARGIIRRFLGRDVEVPSPTYTLVQVYERRGLQLWHCDFYRLSDPAESLELGLDDAFESAIVLAEWPERLGDLIPRRRIEVRLEPGEGGAGRRARVAEVGGWSGRLDDLEP